jgi:hypothetical protein
MYIDNTVKIILAFTLLMIILLAFRIDSLNKKAEFQNNLIQKCINEGGLASSDWLGNFMGCDKSKIIK